jgi:hypothetical protein
MMAWRSGVFDKNRLNRRWHAFAPVQAVDSLTQVDLTSLWDGGKRLLLVDVDNTLVQWHGEDLSEAVTEWLERAKSLGFELCLISNTKRFARLQRLSQKLGVAAVRGRFKPSRAMFRMALAKFRRAPEEAVMIGDQIFTDVLGANRSGIDAIWVRRMDGKEFQGTHLSRMAENMLKGPLYRALVMPEDVLPADAAHPRPEERKTVKQFVRFLVVGGSSFAIDFLITKLLLDWIPVGSQSLGQWLGASLIARFPELFAYATRPEGAAAPILGGIASLIAMFNSFIWNRLWTFEAVGHDSRMRQLRRFYMVSITGALLNTAFFSLFFNILPFHSVFIAKVLAAGIAAVWNFNGMRLYAFRRRDT